MEETQTNDEGIMNSKQPTSTNGLDKYKVYEIIKGEELEEYKKHVKIVHDITSYIKNRETKESQTFKAALELVPCSIIGGCFIQTWKEDVS